ncbi:MAG: hypothetical protein O2782_18225 [bacterium]|nr:hypothetical protein [bacterium]
MTLSTLIQSGGLAKVATATVATVATGRSPGSDTVTVVAGVAGVAVANPQEIPVTEVTHSPPSLRAVKLREQVRQARDWVILYAILDEAQAAYDAGEVTLEEVESLAGYAVETSLQVPEHDEDGLLSALLARQPIVRVRSRLLGEVVVWVSDAVEITEEVAEIVYRESELRQMVGQSPDEVRAIHALKRALDGELIE